MISFTKSRGWLTLAIPVLVIFTATNFFAEHVISRPLNGWLQLAGVLIWLAVLGWAVLFSIKIIKSVTSKNK